MVSATLNRRQTLAWRLWFIGLMIAILLVDVLVVLLNWGKTTDFNENADEESAYLDSEENAPGGQLEPESEPESDPEPEASAPIKIDFQPLIDEWVSSIGGSKGVIIYDLDLGTVAGAYNVDKKFATASLYKLFVVYQGYRLVQNGTWGRNDTAGSTGHTILECLDLAIRESDSPCAETLWAMIGRASLDAAVQKDFGLPGVVVADLEASPREIMQMMKLFYEHADIASNTLALRMKDSFLNQPVTVYDWRRGLPSGFSDDVDVYNKVGWLYVIDEEDDKGNVTRGHWDIYDDAAIVDFVNHDRHFIVVVMTSHVRHQDIGHFGAMIENYVETRLAEK